MDPGRSEIRVFLFVLLMKRRRNGDWYVERLLDKFY